MEKFRENIHMLLLIIATALIFMTHESKDNYIEIIALLFFGMYFSLSLYQDIKNKKYVTSTLIIIGDIIELLAFMTLCYFNYKSIDKTDFNTLWERGERIRFSSIIMLIMSCLIGILKGDRFLKRE